MDCRSRKMIVSHALQALDLRFHIESLHINNKWVVHWPASRSRFDSIPPIVITSPECAEPTEFRLCG